MGTYSRIEIVQSNGLFVIRLVDQNISGEPLYEELQHELIDCIESEKLLNVVVDLSRVLFISMEGVGALLAAKKSLLKQNSRMALCQVSESVQDKLQTLSLTNRIFEVYGTINDAVKALT